MLRLSEAIRLGAMMKPQAFGAHLDDGKTCALGAAIDAIGRMAEVWPEVRPFNWPVEMETTLCVEGTPCPSRKPCTGYPFHRRLGELIIHLNNDHRWTRERIADWVESIESAQAVTEAQPVEQQA